MELRVALKDYDAKFTVFFKNSTLCGGAMLGAETNLDIDALCVGPIPYMNLPLLRYQICFKFNRINGDVQCSQSQKFTVSLNALHTDMQLKTNFLFSPLPQCHSELSEVRFLPYLPR